MAKFICEVEYENITDEAVYKAKLCILDNLGCILGGSITPVGKKVSQLVRYLGGAMESTILGTGELTSCALASFANSEMANALDYDDMDPLGHPGATTIPPAVAIGETLHAKGKQLITAVILGYDVLARVGMAMRTKPGLPMRAGLVWQIFGSVTVAGKLLGLDEDQMAMAMGIAGSATPVPSDMKCSLNPENKKFGMGMVKNNYGYMSEIGVRGALAAKLGYTGPHDILDGDTGFWRMACFDGCDFDEMTSMLGSDYKVLRVGFKSYPCCWNIHSTIDAAHEIISEQHLEVEGIDRIIVGKLLRFSLPPWDDYQPKTMGSAIYSIPYSLAVALTGPNPGPEWFNEQTLRDPKILSLARKIRLEEDPEVTYPENSSVEISSKGKMYKKIVAHPRGHPENPISEDELKEKFMNLALNRLDRKRAIRVLDMILNLDKVKDISALTALLGSHTSPSE